MQVKRIDKWLSSAELNSQLKDKNILDWLNETGSITQRISAQSNFKLEIIEDSLGAAENEEYQSLQINHEEVRIREVILFGDAKPIVYARSIIPPMTSTLGYPGLGTIGGSKPLGDLLFQSDAFSKTSITFAKFHSNKGDVVWGRRANYSVNNYPFSVMEVFLNP